MDRTTSPDPTRIGGHAPSAMPSPRTLLDVKAASRHLSVGRTTLFALLRTGEIESVKIGALRRIPLAAIHAYVQRKADENRAA